MLAARALDGLSVGDAFGECFFSIAANPLSLELHLSTRTLPNQRWRWTDDTAMAAEILELLNRRGTIDQDALAQAFASRYVWDDRRGYGGTAHSILMAIDAGESWRQVTPAVLGGTGSMGNGAAMRVAPLGAFFAPDTDEVVRQAQLSAQVTHAHPEGQAGAIAVALAAAFVARCPPDSSPQIGDAFFDYVLANTPASQTRDGITRARELPATIEARAAAMELGNGSRVTAPDTVPFCLWCVSRLPADFESAMWMTVAAGGDMDTNCAIVGGIIAAGKRGAPPQHWIERREPLPMPLN